MSDKKEDKRQEWTRQMRLASYALAIPTILGASPVVGILLGKWLGGLMGYPRIGVAAGLVIGFAAGVRETIRLIRRLQNQTKS